MVNGYSKARIEKLCKSLGVPYSEDALQILEEFFEERLDYLRNRALPEEMFSVFIDAYYTELREEGLSDHQFCFIHLYRNLKSKLTLKSMKEFFKIWKSIRGALA